ncbi:hypothetical protein H4N54_08080 [Limnospira fusiformis KN01]|uniref:hypothetical protein n=1 Tax=Limnospira TaxID=2596745 RepID=UPI0002804704|nr:MULTISPECIES: hypothetical protein [Limnospira]EKD07181.1 hypothetical protein SPLC1_S490120 [Arthrospira platensis C1]MDC0839081.1 hypothetical protein [Limnoraphis robusta]MDT9190706.1 hypothetical protein [Limnospira sp. PMC 894.15]MDT9236790.1 hypothetical protein [Limnospira sp. PMC 917.15]ULB47277.1 hypothetical protein H4N54_08080 [Limnospira fusiformis KN01]
MSYGIHCLTSAFFASTTKRFKGSLFSGSDRIFSPTFPELELTVDQVLTASGIREL